MNNHKPSRDFTRGMIVGKSLSSRRRRDKYTTKPKYDPTPSPVGCLGYLIGYAVGIGLFALVSWFITR